MDETPSRPAKLTALKKVGYGLIVTATVLIVAESLLALFGVETELARRDPYVGFESTLPLFVEASYQGSPVLQTASNKLLYFNPQRFSRTKSPDTLRVFCLGGSTTFGRPFDDRTSYVGWLRELLPAADQRKRWEVINAGGVSYASYRVASVMDELVQYSPDLFIIYTGHNEFLEERTYGDLKDAVSARRWTKPLYRSRTFSLARRLLAEESVPDSTTSRLPAEVDAILDHSVGPESYHRDDQLRQQVSHHFQFNLRRMIETARSAGAGVILVTPACNLKDFAPFKSEYETELDDDQSGRWFDRFLAAQAAEKDGDNARALELFRQVAELDAGRADLHFQIGRSHFARGEFDQARLAFERAVDLDVCPLRATSEIQGLIERTAIDEQVPLVDFNSILRGACTDLHGHPCPGNEFFLDHVHPTVAAHRLLALSIVEAMGRAGIVAPRQQWDEETIVDVTKRIESRIDPELQARALTNLAQVLSWAGKQLEAGPIAELAVALRSAANLGDDPETMFYAAVNFAVKGMDDEAIELLQKFVLLQPDDPQARWRLAVLLYEQDRLEESLEQFRTAVRLDPQDLYSQQMLGQVLLKLERYEEARSTMELALEIAPDDPLIKRNLAAAQEKLPQS